MLDARKLWAGLGRLGAGADSAQPIDIEAFVEDVFKAFVADGALVDLCAFVSHHSRRKERRWVALRGLLSPSDREALLDVAIGVPGSNPVFVPSLGVWVVARLIGSSMCAALFEAQGAAIAGVDDVALLADALTFGFTIQRRIEDARLMRRLATAPARKGWPRGALHEEMATVARHMRSDGAKIYLSRRTSAGPCIELFSRTDLDDDSPREPYPVSAERGLADWVLLHDDAIIIDDPVTPDHVLDRPEHCHTLKHGQIEVFGRPGRAQDPRDEIGDRERAFLLVPMREQDRVVGVLSFWRLTDDTYDHDLDLASAKNLAAQLVPICQSIVASEVRDAVVHELAKLGAMVAMARSTRDIHAGIVGSAGSLARAAGAVIFLAGDRGMLYGMSQWFGGRSTETQHNAACFSMRSGPGSWERDVPIPVIDRIQQAYPGYRVRRYALPLSPDAEHPPRGVVFLMDRAEDLRLATCDDELAEHEASSFLRQVAPIVFGSYSKVFAASIGPRLREASPAVDRASPTWASAIAQTIREAVGADAVLIYQRELGDLRVTGASTGHDTLLGMSIARDTLTQRCISERRHSFIPDITDQSDPNVGLLNLDMMNKITSTLGWSGVRSWHCQPVEVEAQSLGAIKLLTVSGGSYLDPSCVEIVTAIAAHLGVEMARHFRTDVLEGLNRVTESLSGKEGQALAAAMIQELEAWTRRFIDEDCRVVIMASVHAPHPSVFAASASIDIKSFQLENATQLATLQGPFQLPDPLLRSQQLQVPIRLTGNSMLRGCLLLITEHPVGQQGRAAANDAAREIAILLDYEQRARLRAEQTARFRHALLGPVQGLMNEADEITRMIRRGNIDVEELQTIAAYIRNEANAVGKWRELQRLYASNDHVKVVLQRRPLRPLVERCVDRFREPIRVERESTLSLDFRATGSLDIPMDESAIDLVLNNLLDNARKYAFAHTTITMTVENLRSVVRITVEDIGHDIPDRLDERIYEVGERLDWEDPVRAIRGTGLGLPISRAIALAHNGRLFHECETGISSDPNRSRVRFILELPSGWRS